MVNYQAHRIITFICSLRALDTETFFTTLDRCAPHKPHIRCAQPFDTTWHNRNFFALIPYDSKRDAILHLLWLVIDHILTASRELFLHNSFILTSYPRFVNQPLIITMYITASSPLSFTSLPYYSIRAMSSEKRICENWWHVRHTCRLNHCVVVPAAVLRVAALAADKPPPGTTATSCSENYCHSDKGDDRPVGPFLLLAHSRLLVLFAWLRFFLVLLLVLFLVFVVFFLLLRLGSRFWRWCRCWRGLSRYFQAKGVGAISRERRRCTHWHITALDTPQAGQTTQQGR